MARGRPRSSGANLPKSVYGRTNRVGKTYYYYVPEGWSGTRTALGSDLGDIEFWRRLKEAQDGNTVIIINGEAKPSKSDKMTDPATACFADLISAYLASSEWSYLRPKTQESYKRYLNMLLTSAGERRVCDLTRAHIYQFRDDLSATPATANQMVTMIRTLLEWGVPRGFTEENVACGIKPLKKKGKPRMKNGTLKKPKNKHRPGKNWTRKSRQKRTVFLKR